MACKEVVSAAVTCKEVVPTTTRVGSLGLVVCTWQFASRFYDLFCI